MSPGASGPVRLAVVGAGMRGSTYARHALAHPNEGRVTAIVDPHPAARRRLAAACGLDERSTFDSAEILLQRRLADAVIVASPDRAHAQHAVALLEAGYPVLLEKPIATTEAQCARVVAAAERAGVILGVCHVLRHTPYTRAVRAVVGSGRLGEVVHIDRIEPIGFWHFAHSYVRGNWRVEADSTFSLLAKCCHDLDWILHVSGAEPTRVASFGGLYEFRRDRKPPQAGDATRCADCAHEPDCAFSAPRIYRRWLAEGAVWPLSVVTPEPSADALAAALADGPYGRCVYECDNDVADHQVVSIDFASGATASLTMSAFTEYARRKTRIHGTRGRLEGDGRVLELFTFADERVTVLDTGETDGGHGGGDDGLMRDFLRAVRRGDPSQLPSPAEALAAHQLAFAAERARREGRVVDLTGRAAPGGAPPPAAR